MSSYFLYRGFSEVYDFLKIGCTNIKNSLKKSHNECPLKSTMDCNLTKSEIYNIAKKTLFYSFTSWLLFSNAKELIDILFYMNNPIDAAKLLIFGDPAFINNIVKAFNKKLLEKENKIESLEREIKFLPILNN